MPPIAPDQQSAVNGSKAKVPKIEDIFSKEQLIIFNLTKQGLEKDAEIKLMEKDKDAEIKLIKKDTERMLMEKDKDTEIKLIEKDMKLMEKDKDTEIKLIEKDMKLMEKEINKINLKKWWQNWVSIAIAVTGIGTLYVTWYFGLWGNITQDKLFEVQKEGVRVQ